MASASHRPPLLAAADRTRLIEALSHHQRGDTARAEVLYREVLATSPHSFDAAHLLGVALTQRGALIEGISYLRRASELDRQQPNVRFSLARALLELRDGSALAVCEELVALQPQSADAWLLHGNALQLAGAHERALDDYTKAFTFQPDFAAAFNNYGHSLRILRRTDQALAAFERAVALNPTYAMAFNNRGLTFLDMHRLTEALDSIDRALAIQPDAVEILSNRGTVLMAMKRFAEAAEAFSRVLALEPLLGGTAGNLLYARCNQCDWSDYAELVRAVIAGVSRGELAASPLAFVGVTDDPHAQLACARIFSTARYPGTALWPSEDAWASRAEPGGLDRIRVAYLSGDFGEHAVSYLLAGVIEHHDRNRFETIGVAWGRHGDPMRARLVAAFERFVDITDVSDADTVKRLREMRVDIAVDLAGHTAGQRTGIFTHRAAPIQVNYLGFPATMGAANIDYIVADEFVIPGEYEQDFAERILYLPECFQANDDRRAVAADTPTRVECGLSADAFVWCSFHGSYKITPALFDVWARLVAAVPGSVLWLLGGNVTENNLRREAAARGLDARRLVFAPQLPYEKHLARLSLADVYLDTLPFNGGATTSDALWAGVPVVTCTGRSFAARMSGSLLQTLGLPELVTHDLQDYERAALRLAQAPEHLASVRAQLALRRKVSPLFDTVRFCRHLESGYEAMMNRCTEGLPPATIRVPQLPRQLE